MIGETPHYAEFLFDSLEVLSRCIANYIEQLLLNPLSSRQEAVSVKCLLTEAKTNSNIKLATPTISEKVKKKKKKRKGK